MDDLNFGPSAADLAAIESELPEWDRLAVRDYWETVIAEELGASEPVASRFAWSSMGSGERERVRRYERRTGNTVLRLVTEIADGSITSAPNTGEAA